MVIGFLQVEQVNRVDTTKAQYQHGNIAAQFRKRRKHLRFGQRAIEEQSTLFSADCLLLSLVSLRDLHFFSTD